MPDPGPAPAAPPDLPHRLRRYGRNRGPGTPARGARRPDGPGTTSPDPSQAVDAGSNRLLAVVFTLLVVMTAVAAFAVGGLLSLSSSGAAGRNADAAAQPAPFAVAIGALANDPTATATPDPDATTSTGDAALLPPLVDLTPGANGTAAAPSPTSTPTPTPTGTGAPGSTTSPTPRSSCPPGTTQSPPGGSGGGLGVPLIPLCP